MAVAALLHATVVAALTQILLGVSNYLVLGWDALVLCPRGRGRGGLNTYWLPSQWLWTNHRNTHTGFNVCLSICPAPTHSKHVRVQTTQVRRWFKRGRKDTDTVLWGLTLKVPACDLHAGVSAPRRGGRKGAGWSPPTCGLNLQARFTASGTSRPARPLRSTGKN
uniref:Uncharacterized protein n=1 Tax=Myotis myotis TaxID=51298 RepID=A0A7J7TTL1_MYOMY|nr:hypothetical protein mMyoMyo1_008913 [Myotis myotis]